MNLSALSIALAALGFKKGGGSGTSGVQSIRPGTNITVDNSDPKNPIVSAAGGGSGGFRGALMRQGTAFTNITMPYLCRPLVEVEDAGNCYDVATGIITVPAGVTKARFSMVWYTGKIVASTLGMYVRDADTDVTIPGGTITLACGAVQNGYFNYSSFVTPILAVTPGQKLRFRLNEPSGFYTTIDAESSFSVEWI